MRVYIKGSGATKRGAKLVYPDELLHPIIDQHVTADSLKARPILRNIFPAEFYNGPQPAKKPATEPGEQPTAGGSKFPNLESILGLPPNECKCGQPRAACGTCGLGFEQRQEVLLSALRAVGGNTGTPPPQGRMLKPTLTDASSAASGKKRKAETNMDLLMDSESEDETWEEALDAANSCQCSQPSKIQPQISLNPQAPSAKAP